MKWYETFVVLAAFALVLFTLCDVDESDESELE